MSITFSQEWKKCIYDLIYKNIFNKAGTLPVDSWNAFEIQNKLGTNNSSKLYALLP